MPNVSADKLMEIAKGLLVAAGFAIEACYGDFARTPFDPATAHEQVWIARRPA